jgi:cell division protein FtsB
MNVKRTWLFVGSLATVIVLFIAVFPARTYLNQHRARQQALARIHATDAANQRLEKRIHDLHTDAEVERLARAQYNLVRPGEEAYAILPTRPPATPPAPKPAPHPHRGWLSRAWATITSVL